MTSGETTVESACPFCSGGGVFVVHQGLCPRIKAKEYHPNGTLKRIEFWGSRQAGIGLGTIEAALDFDEPMEFTA